LSAASYSILYVDIIEDREYKYFKFILIPDIYTAEYKPIVSSYCSYT